MQVFDMRYSRPVNNKDTISSLPGNDINAVVKIRCRMVVKFLPRDAMLARYMLSSCVPSVRPSVTSRYSIETTGRIERVFVTEDSFHLSHTVL